MSRTPLVRRALPLLLGLPALLTGCTASRAADGVVAGPAASSSAGPPESAAMVCGDEIRGEVQQVLALPAPPATAATWSGGTFTCTYSLPAGPMTLSVQVLPDGAQAHAALDRGRAAAAAGAHDLAGLGERAWGDDAGRVGVVKDAQVLSVDTTALPPQFGANGQRRTDLAYEVGSDVLGCWTGDEHH